MVINISVQDNGGFLPDIILLTQGYYQWGTRLNTMEWPQRLQYKTSSWHINGFPNGSNIGSTV